MLVGKNPIESQLRAESGRSLEAQPQGRAGATLGWGLGRTRWSLVRQAQGPLLLRREEVQGAGGCWPRAGQVRSRVLGLRNPDCWGC